MLAKYIETLIIKVRLNFTCIHIDKIGLLRPGHIATYYNMRKLFFQHYIVC